MTHVNRRTFLTAAGLTAAAGRSSSHAAPTVFTRGADEPALLGGAPVRTAAFPSWPIRDVTDEDALLTVLRSGRWNRNAAVDEFEKAYASITGASHCLAVANGTSALLTALGALDIGPGDEVIVPPYTFVATINVVLLRHALPVFVDSDPETFQIDASRIEAAITGQTRLIMPVHLGGNTADLDVILPLARSRDLPVVEDACQSHLAEWRGRKVGSLGTAGAFSFQASKNLNSGEGGALITSDAALAGRAYAFHNNSGGRRGGGSVPAASGANLRLTDFQAALLTSQMARLEAQATRRNDNAAYLSARLSEIGGVAPARMYPGCTRNAYHLYMFRYDAASFAGLPRDRFLQALRAEGVPASGGYAPLNVDPVVVETLRSKAYARIYDRRTIDALVERNRCPRNDQLCGEAVWLSQALLLGSRRDMDDIVTAVRKVHAAAARLAATATAG